MPHPTSSFGTMNPSSTLQIPDPSATPGPSRQNGAYRPVSVAVQPTSTALSQPSGRKRASHTVVSSQQQQQQQIDDQPAYHDVHSHPAAVAYAAAHPRRTIPKFGPYLLLQTLGEGEFGKVKLGLHSQWGEEVAVKLIRRGNIDTTVRMSKVEREIEVLRTLKHPNIVRLYDVIETDKYIGIILEYASGGELFDHILAHRYLRERDAAKLFSQLISGVWYIHQKKIVHRDLKLENLLLDRHRNVIITDFGFANRFEHRADDLMQTSCGSPCYAAPELVISEGLYVGSAVDIWSCGVILYAMLAGYLPFDDDPANPDGDNINLLYKYIVNTPLSFPEYISPEARDLLSMMLVPDPSRRADLLSVMAHPWLTVYAHTFEKSVDDLERAAMDQHQMKRLAYQRQMKQAAAAAETHTKVSRTQSARVDPYNATGTSTSRSRSYRDPQPEYLYETSVDQSMYASPTSATPSAPRRGFNPAMVLPPTDDDPFAIVPSREAQPSSALGTPVKYIAIDGAVPAEIRARKDESSSAQPGSSTVQTGPVLVPVKSSPESTKKAGGFRHTIQVEYDEPDAQEQSRATGQSPPKAARREPEEATPTRQVEERSSRVRNRTGSHNGPVSPPRERVRKSSQGSVKPLPVVPSQTPVSPMSASPISVPPMSPSQTSAPTTATSLVSTRTRSPPSAKLSPPSIRTPPPEAVVAPVNVVSSPSGPQASAADKSLQSMRSGGSGGSTSSKQSQHRKGLSVEKLGLAKIFGGPNNEQNGTTSRVPSDGSAGPSPVTDVSNKSSLHKRPSTIQPVSQTGSKLSLLTPGGDGKKSRRNTLTVMVEPISRSIKSRTKGRAISAKEKGIEPQSAVSPPVVPLTASTPFASESRTEIGVGPGMQASTSKARKVMQWFRTKSKGRDNLDGDLPTEDESGKRGATPTQTDYNRKAAASSGTVNQTAPQVFITTPSSTEQPRSARRTPSNATDASSSQVRLVDRIVNVVVPTPTVKGSLRIHHGAVDQTTITTRPPPEVMKHVRDVLDGMGVEVQLESEFKYRCIRHKRKKGAIGLPLRDGSNNGNALTAVTMVGSAASNGVDKRGLPLPSQSSFHSTGGMLRGLLMRRQSSQVSSSGMSASQPSLSFEDDNTLNTSIGNSSLVMEPTSLGETVYGDPSADAGDEVRFSVELTRLDRLNDTFSLDIRRLKGNLRSYKFLYDTLRERADLQR